MNKVGKRTDLKICNSTYLTNGGYILTNWLKKTGTNFKGQKIEENESIRVIGMKNKQMEWKRYEMLSARARYLHYHICWLVQQSEL